MFVLTDCPVPRCAKRHGVTSDKPRRGPAKPYTGLTVSPLRLPGEDPTTGPLVVGVLSEAAERPSTSGGGLTP